jgi:hypothetical protein
VTAALSPRVHRIASLGLLVVAVFAVWGGFFKPLLNLAGQAISQLHDARFELSRARRLSFEVETLSEAQVAADAETLKPLLIWTDSNSGTETKFQEIIDQIIRSTRFNLESMRTATTVRQGNLSRISIDLKGEGPEASVMGMLAEFERHRPLIVVDQLTIRSLDSVPTEAGGTAISKVMAELRISGFGADLASFESRP